MTEFAKPEDHRQSAATSGTMTSASTDGSNHQVNGLSNGHGSGGSSGSEKPHKSSSSSHKSSSSSSGHKSSSKDKHRDKDRDHHRSSSSSHKSGSSSSHKSSHKDKSKDKERSSSSSHKSSSSDKHRDGKSSSSGSGEHKKDRDKDKERHKSSSGSKSSSSSSSKDHKSSSSGSSSKDKSLSSSSSSSHHHSSSSSSSKKRDHKDKERSRDKDKEKRRDRHGDGEERKSEKSSREQLQLPPPSPVREDNNHHHNQHGEGTNGNEANDVSMQDVLNGSVNSMHEMSHNRSAYDPEVYKAQVKVERMDVSQASSCDYSLSQFRDDEQPFVAKSEPQSEDNEEEEEEERQEEEDDDEDVPLFKRKSVKQESSTPAKIKREASEDEDDDEDVPLTARKKVKSEKKAKKEKKKNKREPVDSDDEEPKKKKVKKEKQQQQHHQIKSETKEEPVSPTKGAGRKKKDDAEEEVWKWWEEEKRDDGVKWNTLEHKGPVFAPPYEPLPKSVRFEYDGRPVELSQDAEEIATFYARMLDHEYTSKKVFNDNFFKDWRKSMTTKERDLIKDLSKCNFRHMAAYFQEQSERNKNRSKEEKQKIKEQNEAMLKEYGYCIIDGHKEKIGNFKIEPPGLFRGRGEHPKMGHLKRRVVAEDIILNCSKGSVVPKPPPGHKWKEVRHDNTVTWLASWVENVQGQVKYIMLNPSSRLKGEKDWAKYETARRLDKTIDKIRATYREEWKSKEMRIRQRAVALYFIDKLALRAGNEKDEDQADTVGCCSLRVEHIALHKELNGKENVVVFDFLGKDSIRYYNEVEVEKRVFKNLELFKDNKKPGDDLFDRLNTVVMNEHLRELMDGLTAKVFRTYNASITLQRQLDELTEPNATVAEKLLQYNRANRAVAILCNHQRAVPKTHSKSMENLKEKIRAKREQIKEAEAELKALNKEAKRGSTKDRLLADKKQKQLEKLNEQLQKLEIQETDKDENKTIALGTSKLNYLDPRISVAWCKKNNVPIEKIFNKTQRDKFRWAIDMAGPDYRF